MSDWLTLVYLLAFNTMSHATDRAAKGIYSKEMEIAG